MFDVGWRSRAGFVVCEVKTLRAANHAQQCRLGLGQVLEYQHILRGHEDQVHAVLATNFAMSALHRSVCADSGVVSTSVEDFEYDLGPLATPY
jgi:hypothetical protein